MTKKEKIEFRNGVYLGEVKNKMPHGSGAYNIENGKKVYVGIWENGLLPQGKEFFTYDLISLDYNGDFNSELQFHGMGELTEIDNKDDKITKYKGGWKDGKRHGKGTLEYPDGSKQEGMWHVKMNLLEMKNK